MRWVILADTYYLFTSYNVEYWVFDANSILIRNVTFLHILHSSLVRPLSDPFLYPPLLVT